MNITWYAILSSEGKGQRSTQEKVEDAETADPGFAKFFSRETLFKVT